MAALNRQANSGYESANKPKKKRRNKRKTYGGREERENKTTTTNDRYFLKRKVRQVTTTLQGSRRSQDYPCHSYIVNERYNPTNKRS